MGKCNCINIIQERLNNIDRRFQSINLELAELNGGQMRLIASRDALAERKIELESMMGNLKREKA